MKVSDYPKIYNLSDLPQPDGVYVLHFRRKLKHSGHYIGYSNDIRRRMTEHRNQTSGVSIIMELHRQGITFEPVLFFPGADTNFEYFLKLKYKATPRLCPICKAKGWTPTPISEIHKTKQQPGKIFTPIEQAVATIVQGSALDLSTAPVFIDDGVYPF